MEMFSDTELGSHLRMWPLRPGGIVFAFGDHLPDYRFFKVQNC